MHRCIVCLKYGIIDTTETKRNLTPCGTQTVSCCSYNRNSVTDAVVVEISMGFMANELEF